MLVVQMKRCYPIQRYRSACDSQRERDTHHITLIEEEQLKTARPKKTMQGLGVSLSFLEEHHVSQVIHFNEQDE